MISATPGLTLDHGLKLTYERGGSTTFDYLVISAPLDLTNPLIAGLAVRGRASHPNSQLEIKLEDADGCQIRWDVTLSSQFGWYSQPLPSHSCDLTRIAKLTFAATDEANAAIASGESIVWEIDHVAFTVDPSEIGLAAAQMIDCSAPAHPDGYLPLPCRGAQTNVDNVGYGLAALGVAACLGHEVAVPGFARVEDAISRALQTLSGWPKWNGEASCAPWSSQLGFPWTWFSPTTGLPSAVEPRVFALDQAHLAAALVVLTRAARHPKCKIDDNARELIANTSEALRIGMDWRLLSNAEQQPVLEWCDDTSSCGVPSVCT